MKLTGRAKEKFEKWWIEQPNSHTDNRHTYLIYGNMLVRLDSIPDAFQWGVYQDWADSMGYYFDIEKRFDEDGYVCFGNHNFEKETNTRQEARNAAIEKLNQLINER